MVDAPHTEDLDLAAVRTLEDLVDLLSQVRLRADNPSLRVLAAKTRRGPTYLSKTVAGEMLKGARLPKKAAMVAFLQACGVPDEDLGPWAHAWERIATGLRARTQSEAAAHGMHAQHAAVEQPPNMPVASNETEIRRLREQVNQLAADNEKLRQRLATKTASIGAPRVMDYTSPQDRVIQYFAIDEDDDSEQLFYGELSGHVRNAKEEVLVLGRGFHDESRSSVYDPLIQAEREALRNGVRMVRIHNGDIVADGWVQGYAELLEEFPHKFSMLVDLDGISYSDVILVDPRGRNPVISFLFESREPGELGDFGLPVAALIIKNTRPLARSLAGNLLYHRNKGLEPLNSRNVGDLASKHIYFAWGVHMAPSKMQRDVPDAVYRGTAILYGWRRNIRAMVSGPADRRTIHRTGKSQDSFDGVAYELSWPGKARMDRLERRAYEEVPVEIELDNGRLLQAFTYIPLPKATEADSLAQGSWIDLVVEGARERKMYGLLAELRDAGAPIDGNTL